MGHLNAEAFMSVMAFFVSAVGAKNCMACHDPQGFALDSREKKLRARQIIELIQDLNPRFFHKERLTCYTCHQGKVHPKRVPKNWSF